MNTIYAMTDDRLVYEVTDIKVRTDNWLDITLELVCGYDYVNADENDDMGYIGKEHFDEDVECDTVTCDMVNESIAKAFEYHGYKVIDKLPKVAR